ncbi:MAG TPA: methyltransferase domain-containing protein [Spirochaetota bacterium]|nr:methyltransferase domain-containing protein [Spirochaetota bacterium]
MDSKTTTYYSTHVKDTAELYGSNRGEGISRYFSTAFIPGTRILDIGSGTGRDLSILLSLGYDAYGVDASQEMADYSLSHTPALKERVRVGAIPSEKPLYEKLFNGILCSAMLMHLPDELLFDAAFTIRNNLEKGGRLLLSVPLTRPGIDDTGRLSDGRLFIIRPSEYYTLLFERIGFARISYHEDEDSLGRQGIRWAIMIFELGSLKGRAIDKIESILNRDKKTATYKLALFRALCDIAQTGYNSACWYPDGRVGVDIKSVVDRWIMYYWPLFESPDFIPQLNGEKKTGTKSILFRSGMNDLIDSYSRQGGLSRFYMDLAGDVDLSWKNQLYAGVFKKVSTAIIRGPVVYAGGSLDDEKVFEYNARDRRIVFSADIWRELSLMGHWINDALIMRWGELTSAISGSEIPASGVIDLLLKMPVTERDTQLSRAVFSNSSTLECVWTGKRLNDTFDMDHVIPFSLWRNNDLWNLLPADPKVNNRKREKLPSRELLKSRRDIILGYWDLIREQYPSRFTNEYRIMTGNPFNTNWQNSLFSSISEAVEITALQRGVERWGG